VLITVSYVRLRVPGQRAVVVRGTRCPRAHTRPRPPSEGGGFCRWRAGHGV